MKTVLQEILGDNIRTKVIEEFLISKELEISAAMIIEEAETSKQSVYNEIEQLLKNKIIVTGRKIGKTQTYKLNLQSPRVKKLSVFYDELLQEDIKKHTKNKTILTTVYGVPVS